MSLTELREYRCVKIRGGFAEKFWISDFNCNFVITHLI